MKVSKEVKVGILAVVSLVIFYLGINFLKGIDFFRPNNIYFAIYNDIDGLAVSNPVLINGLTVGRVVKSGSSRNWVIKFLLLLKLVMIFF
ncbi:MAG: hypothetical protein M3421_15220 [Bacteroidota bacterium]|nr:hypothetical protein [Bacteroidota bacterium]